MKPFGSSFTAILWAIQTAGLTALNFKIAVEQTFKPEANVNMVLHQVFDTMLSFAARVLGGEMPDDDAATQWAFEQIYSFVVPNVREELLISSGSTPA